VVDGGMEIQERRSPRLATSSTTRVPANITSEGLDLQPQAVLHQPRPTENPEVGGAGDRRAEWDVGGLGPETSPAQPSLESPAGNGSLAKAASESNSDEPGWPNFLTSFPMVRPHGASGAGGPGPLTTLYAPLKIRELLDRVQGSGVQAPVSTPEPDSIRDAPPASFYPPDVLAGPEESGGGVGEEWFDEPASPSTIMAIPLAAEHWEEFRHQGVLSGLDGRINGFDPTESSPPEWAEIVVVIDVTLCLRDGITIFRDPRGLYTYGNTGRGILSPKYFSMAIDVSTGLRIFPEEESEEGEAPPPGGDRGPRLPRRGSAIRALPLSIPKAFAPGNEGSLPTTANTTQAGARYAVRQPRPSGGGFARTARGRGVPPDSSNVRGMGGALCQQPILGGILDTDAGPRGRLASGSTHPRRANVLVKPAMCAGKLMSPGGGSLPPGMGTPGNQ